MTPSTPAPCKCSIMCQDLGEEGGCRYKQPARETLRRLVDITYQHATEDEQFPATLTADLLIDRAFGIGSIPPSTRATADAGALADLATYIEYEQATGCDIRLSDAQAETIVAALRNSAPQETRGDEPVGDFYLVPREIIDQFPEININNYDHDDSCALNAWGCDVVTNSNPAAASQQSPRLEREGIKVAVRSGFVKFGLVAVRELVDAIADAILALRSPDTTVVSSTHQGDPQSPANHVIKDISDDALFNIATEAWSTQTDHSWSSDGLEAAILAVRSAVETAPPASSTARGEGK